MFKQIKNYHIKCHFYSGNKTFWNALNNEPIINKIKKLSKRNKPNKIMAFDFSLRFLVGFLQ